ncbi:MaoC family dehydratase [Planosporangium flavigriseum]|uniref:MaoC family dehydratase n=1 Tax=Planosporangium flavigriseum TaxID=373681 RepID=UPI00143964A1|nr:MaoC family dehydratase [Planosporangium flavigriseum]NJC63260.1 MaoC family dehydratase [Planosporangium flavigriseum]
MREFPSLAALADAVGQHLGYSDWQEIDQKRVDLFADATGDRQWIHVDPERAAKGPFKSTIAHGFLTLSLVPMLNAQVYRVDGVRMAVNYGLNKVRFPAPLPVGSRVRGGVELVEVTPVEGGVQVVARVTVEVEGAPKPCCVAETVARFYA